MIFVLPLFSCEGHEDVTRESSIICINIYFWVQKQFINKYSINWKTNRKKLDKNYFVDSKVFGYGWRYTLYQPFTHTLQQLFGWVYTAGIGRGYSSRNSRDILAWKAYHIYFKHWLINSITEIPKQPLTTSCLHPFRYHCYNIVVAKLMGACQTIYYPDG